MSDAQSPSDANSLDSFPSTLFSEDKQHAILGHLLRVEWFFTQGYGRIQPGWFRNRYDAKLWAEACEQRKELGRRPAPEEVRDARRFQVEEAREKTRIQAQLALVLHQSTVFGLDGLLPDLTEWMHARIFKTSVERASQLYNKADALPVGNGKRQTLQQAFDVMRSASREIQDTVFEEDTEEPLNNVEEQCERNLLQYENALSFGCSIFDQQLTPQAKSGSLLPGDTTVLLAPTNIGKTTTMITVAIHNVLRGKDVLFITHEGRAGDIKEKMWQCLLNIPKAELYRMYREDRKKLDVAVNYLAKHLTYVPMNKAGLTVDEVAAVIRRKQEDRVARNCGRGYDLLVDDYPAKLVTTGYHNGKQERRVKDDDVYNYFVQLGLEYEFHVLCAIQTNRDGSRANRDQHDQLLSMESAMESWGPMTTATNVISINRDPMAEAMERMTLYICKSRSSERNVAVVCRTKFAHATTHSDELGATWYRGSSSMSDTVDALLKQYLNQGVPAVGAMV